ncbi:hypothetical protein NE237_015074 [Protea cynaroides]|uniref:Small EDRK-rich factor-like N-terminal domain-containing protein n=1 Tax=Protea cynaroides TaxID=273540 RepID=A0A9Q0KD50_9MAGN|nr:hypothetical protein NE237_015074 [Protea cynaroides]
MARNGGKAKTKDDGLTPEQRRERDAKALQEKAAKKAAQAASGGDAGGEFCKDQFWRDCYMHYLYLEGALGSVMQKFAFLWLCSWVLWMTRLSEVTCICKTRESIISQ